MISLNLLAASALVSAPALAGAGAAPASVPASAASAPAAGPPPFPATPQPADLLDFWLGDWTVTWTNANGSTGHARNRVTRVLGGAVIEENFEQDAGDPAPLLHGRSLSVRQQATGTWRQAWVDDQGGFFALTASVDGEKRLFTTPMRGVGDQERGQRMVFHDIRPDAFTWDWQGTTDGGRTWTLLWRIEYARRR